MHSLANMAVNEKTYTSLVYLSPKWFGRKDVVRHVYFQSWSFPTMESFPNLELFAALPIHIGNLKVGKPFFIFLDGIG
jgi:hypothetical protein